MKNKTDYNLLDVPRIGFQILALFDWISPLKAFVEDVREGGPLNLDAWTFFIPVTQSVHSGWSQRDIKKLLAKNDVRTWSHLTFIDEHSFTVSLKDAHFAEQILNAYGVPIAPRSQGAPRV